MFILEMRRTFKRKTLKRDPAILRKAVVAMKLGVSLRAAAREFQIPRSTLLLHRRNNENRTPEGEETTERPTEVNVDNINIVAKGFKMVTFKLCLHVPCGHMAFGFFLFFSIVLVGAQRTTGNFF